MNRTRPDGKGIPIIIIVSVVNPGNTDPKEDRIIIQIPRLIITALTTPIPIPILFLMNKTKIAVTVGSHTIVSTTLSRKFASIFNCKKSNNK